MWFHGNKREWENVRWKEKLRNVETDELFNSCRVGVRYSIKISVWKEKKSIAIEISPSTFIRRRSVLKQNSLYLDRNTNCFNPLVSIQNLLLKSKTQSAFLFPFGDIRLPSHFASVEYPEGVNRNKICCKYCE